MSHLGVLHAHFSLVVLSVALFVARGTGVALQAAWPMRAHVRWASVLIDTALMTAGVTLWVIVPHNPLHEPWLATKLGWLLVYIALGSLALKRGRTQLSRLLWLGAALLVVTQMLCIALTRDPRGIGLWL